MTLQNVVLRRGASGPQVNALQEHINQTLAAIRAKECLLDGSDAFRPVTVDGDFGGDTDRALREIQAYAQRQGIRDAQGRPIVMLVDGIFGPNSFSAMNSLIRVGELEHSWSAADLRGETPRSRELRAVSSDIVRDHQLQAVLAACQENGLTDMTEAQLQTLLSENIREINRLPESWRAMAVMGLRDMYAQGNPVRVSLSGEGTDEASLRFTPVPQAGESPESVTRRAEGVISVMQGLGLAEEDLQTRGGLQGVADIANNMLGMRERGGANRGAVVSLVMGGRQGLEWCGGFVNYVMEQVAPGVYDMENPYYSLNYRALAEEHEAFRRPRELPNVGDVVVFSRGRGRGHVGVVTAVDAETGDVTYVSGNDNNAVRETHYNINSPRRNMLGTVDTQALAEARGISVGVGAAEVALALGGEEEVPTPAREATGRLQAERETLDRATSLASQANDVVQQVLASVRPDRLFGGLFA